MRELDDLHKMILDPATRQPAAAKLVNLGITDLKSPTFNEAKRSFQQCHCLLNARNAEDDKVIQGALENFDFKGLKELLGQVPEDASGEDASTKTFHHRLDRIKETVLDRLTLTKQSLPQPDQFAVEFRKLQGAEREIGDYLKLYKDLQPSFNL